MQNHAPRRWRGGAMGTSRPTATGHGETGHGETGHGNGARQRGGAAGRCGEGARRGGTATGRCGEGGGQREFAMDCGEGTVVFSALRKSLPGGRICALRSYPVGVSSGVERRKYYVGLFR